MQLAAEDLQQSLYENSAMLTSKVALMSTELLRTREDVLALATTVGSLASQVAADERSCSAAASRLRKLDTVKQRVLGTKTTLEVQPPSLECIETEMSRSQECHIKFARCIGVDIPLWCNSACERCPANRRQITSPRRSCRRRRR